MDRAHAVGGYASQYYSGVLRPAPMRLRLLLVATALLALLAARTAAQVPQPAVPPAGGPPRPTAVARPGTPAPPADLFVLTPTLEVSLDAPPAAPAAFDASGAYVPLKSGQLVAIDLATGRVRWTRELLTTWAPAASDGLVVVAGDDAIAGLDAITGERVWTVPVPGGFSAPPLADTGWVLVSPASGHLLAVRARDGYVLWTAALPAPVRARPVITASGVFASLEDSQVVALGLEKGEQLWTRRLGGKPGDLLVLDEHLFVGAEDKFFYSLETKNGKERWKWRTGGRPAGPAAVDVKRVYYVALDNILWALDRNNGGLKWKQALPVRPSGGPIVLGEIVVVAGISAEVYAYGVQHGEPAGKATQAADLVAPPQLVPGAAPVFTSLALVTRAGVFQLLQRRIEPAAVPLSYPLGTEVPLSVLAAP